MNTINPDDAMEAIATLSRPLVTLRENMGPRLATSNRQITLDSMDNAIASLRLAYQAIQRSQPAEAEQ